MTLVPNLWKRGSALSVMPILPYHSASNSTSPSCGNSRFSDRRAQALCTAVPVPRNAPTEPNTSRPA
ncbi:hypothetical protein D3C80_1188510 [compost metagenome]